MQQKLLGLGIERWTANSLSLCGARSTALPHVTSGYLKKTVTPPNPDKSILITQSQQLPAQRLYGILVQRGYQIKSREL